MMFGRRRRPLPQWDEESLAQERALLERGSELLAREGLAVPPYRDPSLPTLKARKNPERGLASIRAYVGALEDCVAEGISLRDTPKLVWRFINRMGMRPEADIFQHIGDDDVVEIYTLENQQLFRNLKFFDFCSFVLEEVIHADWSKVSRRKGRVTLRMLGFAILLKTGRMRRTTDLSDTEEHVVEELLGEKRSFHLQLRYISPLWQDGRVVAALAVHRCRFP